MIHRSQNRLWFITMMGLMIGVSDARMALQAQAPKSSGSATIQGRVKDIKGAGVSGVTVRVEGQLVKAQTAKDGSFTLKGVKPGPVFLQAKTPSVAHLDGETRKALLPKAGAILTGADITLSGRPGAKATYVGMKACIVCHDPSLAKPFDGSPHASIHSRFVTEGTSHMVYPDKWPKHGEKYLPRDPKGNLLKVQDPKDGQGLVHVVLTTKGEGTNREFWFKFYPKQKPGVILTEADLDASNHPNDAVWIQVAATIGGEGNWGKGYVDPAHKQPGRHPDFGEGKQRYMCKVQDVPYLVKWMKENGVSREGQKQDYICYMPVFMMQDGTPEGSKVLAKGQVGVPMFWQKSPDHWCTPDNTLSRNCAGCHATGVTLQMKDFVNDPDPAHKYKSVVVNWDYKDLNITCERCHGPGSDHAQAGDPAKIITLRNLTAKAGNEACGQCHGNHDGRSQRPSGVFKPAFDGAYQNTLGHGFFVPGVYELETFFANYEKPTSSLSPNWKEGAFHAWPDQIHARSHSMELSELRRSAHWSNAKEKLTCFSCHDGHSLDSGPAMLKAGSFNFQNAAYNNNTLCLTCHAGGGEFKTITQADVASLQLEAGRKVTRDGKPFTVQPTEAFAAKNRVAKVVARHMQVKAGMGMALYTPENPKLPTGNCTSCHMPKTGKLQDINVASMYHLDFDKEGRSAVAEGNVASHVFDIVWPAQSVILRNPDPAKGKDFDIMPNSCSKCHASARISGDGK